MDQRNEIKGAMAEALSDCADDLFASMGFRRNRRSLAYKRKLTNCSQIVDLGLQYGPSDNRNAVAAVYPWLSVRIPVMDAMADRMTGGDDSLLALSAPTLVQPIEFVSPKEVGARWYVYQRDSVMDVARVFAAFSEQWLFPFLAEYVDAAHAVALFKSRDPRVIHDRSQLLRVVAAMLQQGECALAHKTLQEQLGRPGNRRHYAKVFEFVELSLVRGAEDPDGLD